MFVIAGLIFSTSYFLNYVYAEPGYEYVAVELDKEIYTWTDRVYITIIAPAHNLDSNSVDEIGNSEQYPVKIATRQFYLDKYKLVETGPDTGIFTGEVRLTGFAHDADGNARTGVDGNDVMDINPKGIGPTDGLMPSDDDDGITVSFGFAIDETVVDSALIQWNEGKVKWLEADYSSTGTGVVRVTDPDMNLDPDKFDNFDIDVWSDSDAGGIDLTLTETNKSTGIFEGTVFFTTTDESSGHRLRVAGEDTITAEYEDNTLPSPYTTADELDITDTSVIQKIPPLPPNKQLMKGITNQDVTCKEKFEKIFRPNGFVACVDSSSVKKLMQKGWSLDVIPIDFTGEWKNKDSRTNDLANLSFTQDGSVVIAHAWSSCSPDICDWGKSSSNVNENIAVFTWKIDSVTHKITVTKIGHELDVYRESLSFKPKWTQSKQMDFVPVNSLQTNLDNPTEITESKRQLEDTGKLQDVLEHCELQRQFRTEEISNKNADGTYVILDATPNSYHNSTHYIDNTICEWKLIDQDKTSEFNELLFMTCHEIVQRNTDGGQYETKDNREFVREKVLACSDPEELLAAGGSCEKNYERYTNGDPYLFEDHQNMAQGTLIDCITDRKLLVEDFEKPLIIDFKDLPYVSDGSQWCKKYDGSWHDNICTFESEK